MKKLPALLALSASIVPPISLQGATNAPAERLRLTIDTTGVSAPFRWKNVPYCAHPDTTPPACL